MRRAFTFVLLLAGSLSLSALLPGQAAAGPWGYYGGRYYPAPSANSSYPVSPSVFPFRTFNYEPAYTYPAPAVNNYYYYQTPAVPSYNYAPSYYARPSYYYAQPSSYYARPSGTSLYANSYYP